MKIIIQRTKVFLLKREKQYNIKLKPIYRLPPIYLLLIIIFLITYYSCYSNKPRGLTDLFPKVSKPIQITGNYKEHLYASNYGINSFDKSERYATVLQTDIIFSLPDGNEPATLGLVDLNTYEFIPLTQTRAWNFQQGCMAHWLGTSPDSLIIFNDLREGKFVSVIMNVYTKKEIKTIPYPVSAVSPDGREAVSINFARLNIIHPGYGYAGNGQDSRKNVPFPKDDGLFLINLESGDSKLLVSYDQLNKLLSPIDEVNIESINNTSFSRKGSRIYFMSRRRERNLWINKSFTVNIDGTNLQKCFPEVWRDVQGSYSDWLNDDELMITSEYSTPQGDQYRHRYYGHILFTVGQQNYKLLGNGLLDYEGNGSFSPDQNWMVYTEPKSPQEQKIYLMDMKTESVLPLGRFVQPEDYRSRCEIHCRWSPEGNIIGFNSAHSGRRQAYIFRLTY